MEWHRGHNLVRWGFSAGLLASLCRTRWSGRTSEWSCCRSRERKRTSSVSPICERLTRTTPGGKVHEERVRNHLVRERIRIPRGNMWINGFITAKSKTCKIFRTEQTSDYITLHQGAKCGWASIFMWPPTFTLLCITFITYINHVLQLKKKNSQEDKRLN